MISIIIINKQRREGADGGERARHTLCVGRQAGVSASKQAVLHAPSRQSMRIS